MIIRRSISKEEIKELPDAQTPSKIEVVDTPEAAMLALSYLNTRSILGIDSETRPSFVKGKSHKVALLQVSSEDICYLFRLNILGLFPELIALLENAKIKKVGLSLKDDFLMLRKRAALRQQSCIDLQEYVKFFGIKDKSLQKIYAILFNEKISKGQRLSNWEAETLSEAQQRYAATDAWTCLRMFNLLESLKASGDYSIAPESMSELTTK